MKSLSSTFTSKGRLVIPAELRNKHKIEAGTKVHISEDHSSRIGCSPSLKTIDSVMGPLADGPDLLASWEKEHREEGEPDK